ncbi:MAG: hypothetical protein JJ902_19150 [Roseibium sp.]|nr:hypothetical protein [Roseibium sp.]
MALISFSAFGKPKPQPADWTQEELAEIYRVLHLLQKAGVSICLDRGLTDKHEPWCAFFDPAGEDVFLHIARIDGAYILVSEIINIRVSGPTLRAATARFEEAIGVVLEGNRDRQSKIVTHPAAQLMFSLAAVFLVIKAKSATASEYSAIGSEDAEFAAMAKVRALLARIQETVDNPALVAALVAAVALGSSSTSLGELGLTEGDRNKIQALVEKIEENAQSAEGGDVQVASVAPQTAGEAAAGTQAAAKAQERGPDRSLSEEPEAAQVDLEDTGPVTIETAHVADQAENDGLEEPVVVAEEPFDAHQTGSDVVVVADLDGQPLGSGSGSSSLFSVIDGMAGSDQSQGGYTVVDLSPDVDLDFSGLTVVARASEASEIVPLLQTDQVLDQDSSTGALVSSLGSSPEISNGIGIASTSPAAVFDSFLEQVAGLVDAFGEFDLYNYANSTYRHVIIVDSDSRNLDGGDLAYLSGEIRDGFSVSLIGSREMIDTFIEETTPA